MKQIFTLFLMVFALALGAQKADAASPICPTDVEASGSTFIFTFSSSDWATLVTSGSIDQIRVKIGATTTNLTVSSTNGSNLTVTTNMNGLSASSTADEISYYSSGSVISGSGTCTTATALPVELIDFTATKSGNGVTLSWSTASEVNNSHFVIERSMDGKDFVEIDIVSGNGTMNNTIEYSYQDFNIPAGGDIFYRLKQVDFDGSYEYSKIVKIQQEEEKPLVVIPNPVSNTIVVNLEDEFSTSSVTVLDLSGRILITQDFTNRKTLNIDISDLIPGQYIVTVMMNETTIQQNRIMKTN